MPASMQLESLSDKVARSRSIHRPVAYNFLREIDSFGLQSFLLAGHLSTRSSDLLCFEGRFIRLEDNVVVSIDVVDSEVVVV